MLGKAGRETREEKAYRRHLYCVPEIFPSPSVAVTVCTLEMGEEKAFDNE